MQSENLALKAALSIQLGKSTDSVINVCATPVRLCPILFVPMQSAYQHTHPAGQPTKQRLIALLHCFKTDDLQNIPRVQLPSQPSSQVIAALNAEVKHRVPDTAAAINRLGDARRTKDGSQRGGIQQHPAAAAGILTEIV